MSVQKYLLSAAAAALFLGGCATTGTPAPSAAAAKPWCGTAAGIRNPSGITDCTASVRTYSQDDLARTGKTTVADALPMLDPSITVAH